MIEKDTQTQAPTALRVHNDTPTTRDGWTILAVWALLAISIRLLLGPVLGPALIGLLGFAGMLVFCSWAQPVRDRLSGRS